MITGEMKAAEKLMNQKFIYEKDGIDSWSVLDIDNRDKVYGDCDDYSLTLAWILSGRSLPKLCWNTLILKTRFYFTKSKQNNIGHLVLKYNGYYIDNIENYWREDIIHKKVFLLPLPIALIKYGIGKLLKH